MSRIFVTGFNSFGSLSINPSEVLVKELGEWAQTKPLDIQTEILRTEFSFAGNRICELIRHQNINFLILIGVAQGRRAINLEQIATNHFNNNTPDNIGKTITGNKIAPDGPEYYNSTLPLDLFKREIENQGVPVRISKNAGNYVCNHVFYKARHEIERLELSVRCGFIHIPLMTEYLEMSQYSLPSLPKELILNALKQCLGVIGNTELNV